jgi:siroheme synthase
MGLKHLPKICASLIAAGLKPSTPACVIENGTLPSQRHVVGTVGTLSASGFHGPALIVVGEVVSFAHTATERRAKAA